MQEWHAAAVNRDAAKCSYFSRANVCFEYTGENLSRSSDLEDLVRAVRFHNADLRQSLTNMAVGTFANMRALGIGSCKKKQEQACLLALSIEKAREDGSACADDHQLLALMKCAQRAPRLKVVATHHSDTALQRTPKFDRFAVALTRENDVVGVV